MASPSVTGVYTRPTATMVIRPATETDIPALVALGMDFLASGVYTEAVVPNAASMASSVGRMIEMGGCFVADVDGRVVSMIGIMVHEQPWSGEKVASELFWWSSQVGTGLPLLRHAEQWATEQGCTELHMIAPEPRVGRLYERRGYTLTETLYRRRLQE